MSCRQAVSSLRRRLKALTAQCFADVLARSRSAGRLVAQRGALLSLREPVQSRLLRTGNAWRLDSTGLGIIHRGGALPALWRLRLREEGVRC